MRRARFWSSYATSGVCAGRRRGPRMTPARSSPPAPAACAALRAVVEDSTRPRPSHRGGQLEDAPTPSNPRAVLPAGPGSCAALRAVVEDSTRPRSTPLSPSTPSRRPSLRPPAASPPSGPPGWPHASAAHHPCARVLDRVTLDPLASSIPAAPGSFAAFRASGLASRGSRGLPIHGFAPTGDSGLWSHLCRLPSTPRSTR
jgi:hypothetical protein